jgi:hypothetical protein
VAKSYNVDKGKLIDLYFRAKVFMNILLTFIN